MKRLPLAAATLTLLLASAAAAYIPSVGSLLRRSVRAGDASRPRKATLRGTLWVDDKPAAPAKLSLQRPLRCALTLEGANVNGVSVHGDPGAAQVEEASGGVGAGKELLELACPLLTFRAGTKGEGERTLRAVTAAAGVKLDATAISRQFDLPVFVLGAHPRQLDVPQLWIYRDSMLPARLLAQRDGKLVDLRLLQYGSAASGEVFPRVLELYRSGKLAARFEASESSGGRTTASGEDDDRE